MKLIIDIPDTQYNNIMEVKSMCLGRVPYKGIIMNAINGIKNGTPLPKGHDRLVEARAVVKALFDKKTIYDVPTIIEADKAESEEISERNLKMWEDIYAEEKRRQESEDKE